MTRTSWLSALTCTALLAAISGCGSSTPANKTGNAGTNGGDAAAGSTGTAGSGGATGGSGGDTSGQAGATAGSGGATAGSGGATAGSGGATAGSGGATAGSDGGAAGAGGTNGDGSTDTPPPACVAGNACPTDFTCQISRTCRANQEELCFCDPDNKIACESCSPDNDGGADGGGTDAGADAGTDGGTGLAMCPANVNNHNTTCDKNAERCAETTCSAAHRQMSCICVVTGASGRWFCGFTTTCQ